MQDGHVHTEWSWDTVTGAMRASCERAIDLGLDSIAFTEHADLSRWSIPVEMRAELPEHFRVLLSADGVLTAPQLDVPGYLAAIEQCRERFRGLRILSGVELSEPHWHAERAGALARSGDFDRVLGSVHALRGPDGNLLVDTLHGRRDPAELVRGAAVSFGSDAHDPLDVAKGFAEASALVEAAGFRANDELHGFWVR